METVTEVPARLKAAVNEPRVRVLCGLRIARFVERCHVRTADAAVSAHIRRQPDLSGVDNFAPAIDRCYKRSSEIKLFTVTRDRNCEPNNSTNRCLLHTHPEMYVCVIPPAVYTRGPLTDVRRIRRKHHHAGWLIFWVAYYASICTVCIWEITSLNVNAIYIVSILAPKILAFSSNAFSPSSSSVPRVCGIVSRNHLLTVLQHEASTILLYYSHTHSIF